MALTTVAVGVGGTGSTDLTLTSPIIAGTPTGVGVLTLGTAVATTSGTSVLYTGIPSWVKRITVIFNGVAIGSNSFALVQLGSTTLATTGYNATTSLVYGQALCNTNSSTTGFIVYGSTGTLSNGTYIFNLISGTTWIGAGTVQANSAWCTMNAGSVTLSGVLDRVNISGSTGGTFAAGSVNIMYE